MKLYAYEVIDKMVERIKKHGWAQGGYGGAGRSPRSPGCLLVTLSRTIDFDICVAQKDRQPAIFFMVSKLVEYLKLDVPKVDTQFLNMSDIKAHDLKCCIIAKWNDDPDRTRNQLLNALVSASFMAKLKQDHIYVREKENGYDEFLQAIEESGHALMYGHQGGKSILEKYSVEKMIKEISLDRPVEIHGQVSLQFEKDFLSKLNPSLIGMASTA